MHAVYIGMDVHEASITMVLPIAAPRKRLRGEGLPTDHTDGHGCAEGSRDFPRIGKSRIIFSNHWKLLSLLSKGSVTRLLKNDSGLPGGFAPPDNIQCSW